MQQIELEALPGHIMTVELDDGHLLAAVYNGDDVQVCTAQWQVTTPS